MAKNIIGKKGSITDLPFIMVGVFTMAIIGIMVTLLLYHLNTQIQANDVFDSRAQDAMDNMSTGFPRVINTSIVVVFFAMCIISFILASLVPIHPAFLFVYVFEWIILVYVGGGIANAYQMVIENQALAVISNYFIFSTQFFRFFPYIVGIAGGALAVIMYKARGALWGQ